MRVLIFTWRDLKHSWAGGAEIYIFEQATRWVKMGHDVTVFCGQDFEKELPAYEVINGVKIYRKGGRFSLYIWAVWYYLKYFRGKMDVVIDVENGIPFFTPLFCRIPKVCYVYHVHGKQFFYEMYPPFNYYGYLMEKYVFPLLYKNLPLVVISETTKLELIKIGFNKKKITVVYSGMNGKNATVKNGFKKFSHPTILYLGRIKRYKRVDLLVKLLPKIIEKVPNVRLVIAGWGTEASNVVNLIMKSPLRRKIILMGPVSDAEKRALLTKSWLFVNPSIGEGWSIAVIEANLYGTPAVAFNVPGLAESIQSGKTGLLAADSDDLVNKVSKVLSSNILRERLGKNAKTWASKFSWDQSALESMHILKKAWRNK